MKTLSQYITESVDAKCTLVIDGEKINTSKLKKTDSDDSVPVAYPAMRNFLKTLKGKNAEVTGEISGDATSGNLTVKWLNRKMTIEWAGSTVKINGKEESVDIKREQWNGDLPNYGWLTRIWLKYGE